MKNNMEKKKVLFISSLQPGSFAGLGYDMIAALQHAGYEVTYLTLYKYRGKVCENLYVHKYYKYVCGKDLEKAYKSFSKKIPFFKIFNSIISKLYPKGIRIEKDGIAVINDKENEPPVPVERIVKLIKDRKFDFVLTGIWEFMITTATLKAIYKETGSPIISSAVDMYPLTGGCYYPNGCTRYLQGCINCPVFKGRNNENQAHENFLYKKTVYDEINIAFQMNTYQKQIFVRSGIIPYNKIVFSSFTLNEKVFKPQDDKLCRKYLKIPENKKFIILSRYVPGYIRKGTEYLKSSMKIFINSLSLQQKKDIILLLLGHKDANGEYDFGVDSIYLGTLKRDDLIKAYSVSSVYVSTSIDDAGPSMVNQSMACGTPVVAFELGTAIDVIKNGISGYLARYKDSKDMANGIQSIYNLSSTDFLSLKKETRNLALEMNSFDAFKRNISDTLNLLNKE